MGMNTKPKNNQEVTRLRSQFAILKTTGRGKHRKYFPYVFTEHGALMLANVLRSKTAIRASIQVVQAFIKLREMVASHKDIARKLEQLEQKVASHDFHIKSLFDAIHQLMQPPVSKKRQIGFRVK